MYKIKHLLCLSLKIKLPNFATLMFISLMISMPAKAVIGGKSTTINSIPCVVSIQRNSGTWQHVATGVLLGSNCVLTSAHIVDGISPSQFRVVAGIDKLSNINQTSIQASISGVTYYQVHQEYGIGDGAYSNDIAVLYLQSPFMFTPGSIEWARLPISDTSQLVNAQMVIAGWGTTGANSYISDDLMQANISSISNDSALSMLQPIVGANIWDKQLPVYDSLQNITIGKGDGPLFLWDSSHGWCIVGIASWTIPGAHGTPNPAYPAIFTRIPSYLDWLNSNAVIESLPIEYPVFQNLLIFHDDFTGGEITSTMYSDYSITRFRAPSSNGVDEIVFTDNFAGSEHRIITMSMPGTSPLEFHEYYQNYIKYKTIPPSSDELSFWNSRMPESIKILANLYLQSSTNQTARAFHDDAILTPDPSTPDFENLKIRWGNFFGCGAGIITYGMEFAALCACPETIGLTCGAAVLLHPYTVYSIATNCPGAFSRQ